MTYRGTFYLQNDTRWKNKLLGYNTDPKYNIGNYGCLITSLSNLLNHHGEFTTPEYLNDLLKENNGFQPATGYYKWGSISDLYTFLEEEIINDFRNKPVSVEYLNKIDKMIKDGLPVCVGIDINNRTTNYDQHFVDLIGGDYENGYEMVDPVGNGSIEKLNKYLGGVYKNAAELIYQIAFYTPKQPNTIESAITVDVINKINKLDDNFDKINLILENQGKVIEEYLLDKNKLNDFQSEKIENQKKEITDLLEKNQEFKIGKSCWESKELRTILFGFGLFFIEMIYNSIESGELDVSNSSIIGIFILSAVAYFRIFYTNKPIDPNSFFSTKK